MGCFISLCNTVGLKRFSVSSKVLSQRKLLHTIPPLPSGLRFWPLKQCFCALKGETKKSGYFFFLTLLENQTFTYFYVHFQNIAGGASWWNFSLLQRKRRQKMRNRKVSTETLTVAITHSEKHGYKDAAQTVHNIYLKPNWLTFPLDPIVFLATGFCISSWYQILCSGS